MIKADDIITKLENEGWWIDDTIRVDSKDFIQEIIDETIRRVKNINYDSISLSPEEFLKQKNIPDRTITGRKPTGQFPEYRSSLSELLEEYRKQI